MAIASNESLSGWTKPFTDPRLCAALVDRLTFGVTGMLRGHLPRRQPAEASPHPARCEDEMPSLDPARLVGSYAFCSIYPLFRGRYDPAVVDRTKGCR